MGDTSTGTVAVSRRVEAPASRVFALLADPQRHPDFDGSGMLREGAGNLPVTAPGDVFTIRMHNDEMGDYEMGNRVVEYQVDRRITWEPFMTAASRPEYQAAVGAPAGYRWGYLLEPDGPDATVVTEVFDCTQAPEWLQEAVDGGRQWLPSMVTSLERLSEASRSEARSSS